MTLFASLRGSGLSRGLVIFLHLAVGFTSSARAQQLSIESLSKPTQEALGATEFRAWPLEWVTGVEYQGVRYDVLYAHHALKSALILLRTELASRSARIIKNDTSLFPFNERSSDTPPKEVRLALAEGEMSRQADKFGSWAAYFQTLRRANLLPYLAKEQREVLRRKGFEIR